MEGRGRKGEVMLQGIRSHLVGVITVAWLGCFTYLGFAPRLPELPGFSDSDSVAGTGHFLASLILAVLVFLWILTANPLVGRWRAAAAALVLAIGFGAAVELVQAFLPDREPELGDAALDALGALTGVVVVGVASTARTAGPVLLTGAEILGVALVVATVAAIAFRTPPPASQRHCPGDVAELAPLPSSLDLPFGAGPRVREGLVALYELTGDSLADKGADTGGTGIDLTPSGSVDPLDPVGVRFSGAGGALASEDGAAGLVNAINDQFTVEAWVRPETLKQYGPVRIVTMSGGSSLEQVNFHLGQERHCLSVRVAAGGDAAEWLVVEDVFRRSQSAWHVAATYSAGRMRAYADGQLVLATTVAPANLDGWSADYPLLIGNELQGDRPFTGDVYLVAVYDRALSAAEVERNRAAGLARP